MNVDIRDDFGVAMTKVLKKTKSPASQSFLHIRNNKLSLGVFALVFHSVLHRA